MSSLAHRYGFASYHLIYDHPNNSSLRKKRPNPNILYPGDVVFIPELELGEQQCGTDKRHKFQMDVPKVLLRVKLLDNQRQPYKYKRYQLDVADEIYSGHTDAKGLMEQSISPDETQGTLHLWLADAAAPNATTRLSLRIGHLDPVNEVTGIQARLNHLRFDCGAVDGIAGPKTAAALRAFQKSVGLPETGAIDDATKNQLQSLHDNE